MANTAPKLKHVEKVRDAIVSVQQRALTRLRLYLSSLGENQEAVDSLHGKDGDLVLARVTDLILRELGHAEALDVDDTESRSKTRRAAMRRP